MSRPLSRSDCNNNVLSLFFSAVAFRRVLHPAARVVLEALRIHGCKRAVATAPQPRNCLVYFVRGRPARPAMGVLLRIISSPAQSPCTHHPLRGGGRAAADEGPVAVKPHRRAGLCAVLAMRGWTRLGAV